MVLVYVDDILIFDDLPELRDRFTSTWGASIDWDDFGTDFHDFLSMRIQQFEDFSIKIDSLDYIDKLVAEVFPGGVHTSYAVPAIEALPKMVRAAVLHKDNPKMQLDMARKNRYAHIVCSTLYVAITTRPDVMYAVGMLTRCLVCPTEQLLKEAERVLIYLHGTRELGITYTKQEQFDLTIDWAPAIVGNTDSNYEIGRSTSGGVYRMSNAAVLWFMKKQAVTALNTYEAELMAGTATACDGVGLRYGLEDIGFPMASPTKLFIDNTGSLALAKNPVLHEKAKHIHNRELRLREMVADGLFDPIYVKSCDNVADIFTKPLGRAEFQKHRKTLLNLP